MFIVATAILIISITVAICLYTPSNNFYLIQNKNLTVKITMKKYNDSTFSIISTEHIGDKENIISEWKLNYPVYHFECSDINADGIDDILIGVIKPTRFDKINRKRIFIFKLFEGYVRPLWLGSRVSQPLEDFKVITSKPMNLIRTIECEKNGSFLVAEYKWKGFGLTFVKYIVRNSKIAEARKIFNQTNTTYENN